MVNEHETAYQKELKKRDKTFLIRKSQQKGSSWAFPHINQASWQVWKKQ